MSRIFLVSSNTIVDPYPVYPVGMAIIASALTRAGHEVRQFDFLAEEQSDARLRKAIYDFGPHYVGISIRNIDAADHCLNGNDWYLSTDLGLIKIIREATPAPVILGGSAFSVMPEEILNYLGGDYGIAGEGEQAVCDLIEALNEGLSVPAITRKGAAFCSGDAMTCQPLWEPGLVNFYTGRSGMISMQTKRGCPYKCVYCTYPAIEGDIVRQRPPDDIADEVEKLQKTYGINTFYFTDSIFNDEEGGYLNVAETLVRRGIKIKWAAFFRPEEISKDRMSLLKQSGLYAIEAGSDAASDETLSGLNKQFTFDDVYEFNQACVDAQIPCAHYVIFGGPGESEASVRKGFVNLEMLKNCVVFAFSGIRIFPGTMIQAQAIEEGVLRKSDSLLKPTYYFSPEIDVETMDNMVKTGFKGRRDRIFPPSQGLEMARVMNKYGYYGLLWDRLISFR
ncbi:MAG: lipid biosynthesis B12-binding/radical SAM protein [Syntrophus sp. (in: bacteria)]|nr:lipid biosynthesis B12-binding/radical SAM protein [Syntrophus sp. (in: bacteria)]